MASVPQGTAAAVDSSTEGQSYTIPLIIITILFFMWGSITSLNDVLMPHLKGVYNLSYKQTALVQLWFFGAYFLVSIPAGLYVRSFGYQKGAVTGLIIAATGCFLFYPAATNGYIYFLFSFFILAAGITVLQVSANPYVAALGPAQTSSSRLTLTQAFNSFGTWFAPTFIGALILGGAAFLTPEEIKQLSPEALIDYRAKEAASVQAPYLGLGLVLFALGILFAIIKLPKISYDYSTERRGFKAAVLSNIEAIKLHKHLALGVVGIFLYVGAEVSIGSYLVNFFALPEIGNMQEVTATKYLGLYWLCAMIGRFIGFTALRRFKPGNVLAFNSVMVIVLVLLAVVISGNQVVFTATLPLVSSWSAFFSFDWHLETISFVKGHFAMLAIILVGLFNSIMFPTIFTIALKNLGKHTSQGSGLLCMAIVGGAIVPFIQAAFADSIGLQLSFLLPAICYIYICFYGKKFATIQEKS